MSWNARPADLDRPGIPQRAAAALTLTFALAACGGTASSGGSRDYGFPQALQEPDRTITVWVDAQRAPAVEAFQKAHPEVRVNATTYDGSANGSKTITPAVAGGRKLVDLMPEWETAIKSQALLSGYTAN